MHTVPDSHTYSHSLTDMHSLGQPVSNGELRMFQAPVAHSQITAAQRLPSHSRHTCSSGVMTDSRLIPPPAQHTPMTQCSSLPYTLPSWSHFPTNTRTYEKTHAIAYLSGLPSTFTAKKKGRSGKVLRI